MAGKESLEKIDDYRWRIPKSFAPGMRVPGLIYANEKLLVAMEEEPLKQVANVAHLPGVVNYSLAMPDIHWGYGFCLTKDAKILTDLGFYKPIKDFEMDWPNQCLKSMDLHSKRPIKTSILRFIKLKPKEIFTITTKSGYEIKATGDHPLLTPWGMRPVKELTSGEKVAISPFQGISYENPSNEIIISEKDIRKTLLRAGRKLHTPKFEIVLQKLKKRNLLSLTYNHPKLPYILKIMAFVFGDGTMNFIGKRGDGVLHFSGKSQDLEEVRQDLKKIGYTPGPIHLQRQKASQDSDKYHDCYSFIVNASSLVIFLETLGVPRGRKVSQAYRIPKWIFKAPLWQKRLFLASLFGCELRMPHSRLHRRGYFNAPVFPMAKREELIRNGKDFLKDISKLLKEFGVRTLYVDKRRKHINTKGEASWALELIFSPKPENLLNLWGKIGFEYNIERSFKANVAVGYLRLKQRILREKEEAINVTIPSLLKNKLSYQKIALQLAGNPLTKRFIIDVCWKLNKDKKVVPRVPASFPLFKDYLKVVTEGLGQSGMVWDDIGKIEKVPCQDFVYDFTVSHSDHNFIADNFVVSNCIGGVAAVDTRDGVISPGGIGYDINCLCGKSLILHSLGYHMKIEDFQGVWPKQEIRCLNFRREISEETRIARFLKRRPENKVYKVITKTGKSIIATEDHPFYTKDGMKPLKDLGEGEDVAVYPFEGVPYEESGNEVVLTEEKVKKLLLSVEKDSRGQEREQILLHLRKRNLTPLRYSSPQLPYLIKIMGYAFGDGAIHFVGGRGKGISWFYGKEEDLEEIRQDIMRIGYRPSRIYRREREHQITTSYSKYQFTNTETSFKVCSSSFAALLVALGTPLGNKTNQKYGIPAWLLRAPRWQKRLFLAAFFGAEMSSPKTLSGHKYNFYSPAISMNKKEKYLKNGLAFLEEIGQMLREFDVPVRKVSSRLEKVNDKGGFSYRLRLLLSNRPQDMINLYGKIGFEYNCERSFLANVAIHYLKYKQLIIEEREGIAVAAGQLKQSGWKAEAIYEELGSSLANQRFIERSFWEGRKTSPRMPTNSLGFGNFLKDVTKGIGKSGMVWDGIVTRQEISFHNYVYDFTVRHPDHNFIANNFVVSNCGVRALRTNLEEKDVKDKMRALIETLFSHIPSGVGSRGELKLNSREGAEVLHKGAQWMVEKGYGTTEDIEFTEERGRLAGADPTKVSQRAMERGAKQQGTLGSGNHFLEVQIVKEIYEPEIARAFGIEKGRVIVMIHSGSRGLGYQVCDDYLRVIGGAVHKYGIELPDRQLACAPLSSPEGKDYFAAMAAAANYAWANRQYLMHLTREVFASVFKATPAELGMGLIYDVAHNIGKFEEHTVGGTKKKLFIHRKGATRAFPPGHPELPARYKAYGQPVIIPGDMGRASYLLSGTELAMVETFGSTCHGAGRVMSRTKAIKAARGRAIYEEMEKRGVVVRAEGRDTLAEEFPEAYKDVDDVTDVVHQAGISRKVAKMKPLGVIKG